MFVTLINANVCMYVCLLRFHAATTEPIELQFDIQIDYLQDFAMKLHTHSKTKSLKPIVNQHEVIDLRFNSSNHRQNNNIITNLVLEF